MNGLTGEVATCCGPLGKLCDPSTATCEFEFLEECSTNCGSDCANSTCILDARTKERLKCCSTRRYKNCKTDDQFTQKTCHCDKKKNSCLAADTTLALADGREVAIGEIRVGDRVLSWAQGAGMDNAGAPRYADVVFLPHAANSETTSFVRLVLASGATLELTSEHLLPTKPCSGGPVSLQPASIFTDADTADGICTLTTAGGLVPASSASKVSGSGVYSVITTDEYIVVNGGLVVSPFAHNHFITHRFYNLHRALYWLDSTLKDAGIVAPSAAQSSWLAGLTEVAAEIVDRVLSFANQ